MILTVDQFIAKQRKALAAFEDDRKSPLRIAAYDTHAKMCARIFEEGENAEGGNIGTYNSTNPLYINPNTSPKKLAPKGKDGQTKFKNGKPHKTAYVSSYKDYRSKIGRQVSKVDFILSGELRSDFSNGRIPTPEKVNNYKYVAGVKKEINAKKIEGLEEKFGTVFKLTKEERKNFKDIQEFELKLLLG